MKPAHPITYAAARRAQRIGWANRTTYIIAAARLVLAGLIIAFIVTAYYPFSWDPPWIVRNDVTRTSDGSLRFGTMNQARTAGVPSWLNSARHTGIIDLRLDVRPASLRQQAPASMMMLASDYWHTDFAVEQYRSDLSVWLRRLGSDVDGDPPFVVDGVFRPSTWTKVVVLVGHRAMRIIVDGRTRLVRRLPADSLRLWGAGQIALGDEVHGGGPWQGTIRRAEIDAGGHRMDYVRPGALATPATYWYVPDHLEPFPPSERSEWFILLVQLAAFIPVGLLIVVARKRSTGLVPAALLGSALAVVLAAGKLLFHARHLAIADVVFESVGAWVGAWVATIWLRRHTRHGSASPRPESDGPGDLLAPESAGT